MACGSVGGETLKNKGGVGGKGGGGLHSSQCWLLTIDPTKLERSKECSSNWRVPIVLYHGRFHPRVFLDRYVTNATFFCSVIVLFVVTESAGPSFNRSSICMRPDSHTQLPTSNN